MATSDEVLFIKSDKVSKLNKWYKFAAICVAITCVIVSTCAVTGLLLLLHDQGVNHNLIQSSNHLAQVGNQYVKSVNTAANGINEKLTHICQHITGCQ